ncbi:hypothetical protein [Streptomyces aidingensis]|uniref:Uncharacterized protein n=1 Tax=Streptomyces aidingensis TaxID=910347 RepID=A0A1I1PZV1_9ACTN|nr:hypothetical protein [Streptomyces aidingensis]SFD13138.1 hypothetical protein SAMN05421773_11040 [Streptomyces aidingensis]
MTAAWRGRRAARRRLARMDRRIATERDPGARGAWRMLRRRAAEDLEDLDADRYRPRPRHWAAVAAALATVLALAAGPAACQPDQTARPTPTPTPAPPPSEDALGGTRGDTP